MSDAQWTRTTYMDQTRAQADARQSDRWSDPDVRYVLGMVHAREWKRLLNANNVLRVGTRTVAQDINGQFTVASLDGGSGDSQERFYRVLSLVQDVRLYAEMRFTEAPTAATTGGYSSARRWYRTGDLIQCLPVENGASMTVTVNHLPTPIDQLSSDAAAAVFPRDYEMIVAWETAAAMLMKGGAESDAAQDLQQLAEQMRGDMLGDLARQSVAPMQMQYPDRATEWAG